MPGIYQQSHRLSHFLLAYCKRNSFKAQSRGLTAHTQTSVYEISGATEAVNDPSRLKLVCSFPWFFLCHFLDAKGLVDNFC